MKYFINVSDKCNGKPPGRVCEKIEILHKKMDEWRLHAEKRCRKIMTPAAPFGPKI